MGQRPRWWLSVLARIRPLTWISARAARWPVVGPVVEKLTLPLFSGDSLNITYLPIQRPLSPPQGSLLPIRVGKNWFEERPTGPSFTGAPAGTPGSAKTIPSNTAVPCSDRGRRKSIRGSPGM